MTAVIRFVTTPIGAMVAAAVTIAVIVLIALSGGDDDKPDEPAPAPNAPQSVSAGELSSLAASTGRPVYWAGERATGQYELTRIGADRVAVRYPAGPGADPAAGSLTVATYRLADPIGAIRAAGRSETAKLYDVRGGGLAVHDTARPTNTYLAFPKEPYQVEVFDPKPGRSLRLVLRGRIRQVP